MMLENACFPLPSEIILPLAGNMAAIGIVDFFWVSLVANAGALIGSLIAYSIGYYGGRPFILKYGKYVLISESKLFRAEKSFNNIGISAIFIGRLFPLLRTFISIPAGLAKMDIKKFVIFSLIGIIPWNLSLIFLGYKFGKNYATKLQPIFNKLKIPAIITTVLFIFVYILYKQKSSRQKLI
ncbi:MAG TPA: DedA family protein [Clostridiales bacterium]|nr:DedA family protein [Clostridiales bacterium]